MKKKYHLISLGCPKNLIDSEIFSGILNNAGYASIENPEEAELIIINTCGFINTAKEESINTIIDAAEYKEHNCRKLIVTGCLVKRYLEDLKQELPEVDHFVNLKDFAAFADILKTENKGNRILLTPSHYAYLRISDGCENFCSYCAIPLIRGPLQSIPIEEIVEEATILAQKGVVELIITAQDTALYGTDIYGKSMLVELLRKIDNIDGIKWIRLLYLHPAHLSEEMIIGFSTINKLLPYFDIPLQHIDDDILTAMNRNIDSEGIERILHLFKKHIPNSAIRTTFILGFPGETYHKFNRLKNYISNRSFHRLGVFGYSNEEDTAAYNFDKHVSEKTIAKRVDEIMATQQDVSSKLMEKFIGQTLDVIIDKKSDADGFLYEGRSFLDAPDIDGTVFIKSGTADIGDIVSVEITDAWEYDLIGEIK